MSSDETAKDPIARQRLDEHEEVHEHHDRRISTNENWRLQAQGAVKVLALIVGAGGVGYLANVAGLV
jgi:hypothetical protein